MRLTAIRINLFDNKKTPKEMDLLSISPRPKVTHCRAVTATRGNPGTPDQGHPVSGLGIPSVARGSLAFLLQIP